MYEYNAFVTKVYDADTITVNIDLGFLSHLHNVKIRLFGINAPEVRGTEKEAGKKSRDWLRERILNKPVFIKTYRDKTGKYGRWLADVYPQNDHNKSFNQLLVEEGLAVERIY